jgi:hypothetical protein
MMNGLIETPETDTGPEHFVMLCPEHSPFTRRWTPTFADPVRGGVHNDIG